MPVLVNFLIFVVVVVDSSANITLTVSSWCFFDFFPDYYQVLQLAHVYVGVVKVALNHSHEFKKVIAQIVYATHE